MEVIRDHTAYAYSKLPSPTYTRLLELQPSEDPDAELRCRLYAVELYAPATPFYEAISYTWGTNTPSQTLIIDIDRGTSTYVLITTNLSDALRRLRSGDTPRALWADAVCINQKDDVEKSRHIPLMTDIYRAASRVLVWLGGNFAEEEQALLHIKRLARHVHSNLEALSSDLHRQGLIDAVTDLVHLPWFSRRWIIQEVVLNPDVVLICGSQQLSFGRLGQLVDWLSADDNVALVVWKGFSAMFDLWKRSTLAPPAAKLFELIINFELFECADARDRIFTLLTFATDVTMSVSQQITTTPKNRSQQGPVLSIDYSSSIEDVYTSTAISLVETRGLEWVLIQAMTREDYGQRPGLLPSWVPDWRIPPQRRPLWQLQDNTGTDAEMRPGQISKLQGTEAHILEARLVTVRDLDRPALRSLMRGYSSEPMDPRLATLTISSKSGGCPSATGNRFEIISWIRSTFFEMWKRSRDALVQIYHDPSHALLEKYRVEFIAQFARAITMNGQFRDELHLEDKHGQVILNELLRRFKRHSQKTYETTVSLRDAIGAFFRGNSSDAVPPSDFLELSFRFSIHYLLDVDDLESISMFDTILDLIALSMKGRCIFQADWGWNRKYGAQGDILGTGPAQLVPGDKVIFFNHGTVNQHVSLPMVVRAREMDPSIHYSAFRTGAQSSQSRFMYTFIGDCFVSLPDELFSKYVTDDIELVII